MSVRGGAIQPVKQVSSSELMENGGVYTVLGRSAMPVHGFSSATRPVGAGPATPVYVVSQAEVDAGKFTVDGGAATPIIDIVAAGSNRPVQGRQAIPVFLKGGSL